MLKKLFISLLFFTVSCSEAQNIQEVFLQEIVGTWKVTTEGSNWFVDNLSINTVNPGDTVDILANGNFSLGGIDFIFIEVEGTGIIALYSFMHGTDKKYTGLGFGIKNDVLILPVSTSQDGVPISPDTGVVFLER